jgi:hypothetical protein
MGLSFERRNYESTSRFKHVSASFILYPYMNEQ